MAGEPGKFICTPPSLHDSTGEGEPDQEYTEVIAFLNCWRASHANRKKRVEIKPICDYCWSYRWATVKREAYLKCLNGQHENRKIQESENMCDYCWTRLVDALVQDLQE
jgi:hypothetical protein